MLGGDGGPTAARRRPSDRTIRQRVCCGLAKLHSYRSRLSKGIFFSEFDPISSPEVLLVVTVSFFVFAQAYTAIANSCQCPILILSLRMGEVTAHGLTSTGLGRLLRRLHGKFEEVRSSQSP